jgi:hypothetical protein|tara:strand:+ start:403 stop:840 length:438 start_codon:yes stop_codon:yes gene_type:complete
MAITANTITNSFKKELIEGKHNFSNSGGSVFKLAMYTSAATLGSGTTSFTTGSEASSSSGGYSSGGRALVNTGTSVSSGIAITDYANLSFTGVTLTARGALIYNTSNSNSAVAVLDFGGDKTATAGTFTIQFPAFTTSAAILRIA